ncbi:MAG: porin family protein [Chloroflexota bacterium]|nr:porin family protein [Lentimicrobium sp.]
MKTKIFLLALILAVTVTAQAQSEFSFGIRAGVNFQNINGKDANGDQLENDLTTGFNVGVNMEIPVGTDIYFQPGLLFTTKGTKSTNEILTQQYDTKLSTSNIELPLNIVFKPLLGTGHMLLGFGPYVAYGIGGKYKLQTNGTDLDWDVKFKKELTDAEVNDEVFYLKPFDAGANFLIGYEMANRLSLQLNAQLGLLNIHPDNPVDKDSIWKNTGFGLSLGYRF